jgi:hypothetical protein
MGVGRPMLIHLNGPKVSVRPRPKLFASLVSRVRGELAASPTRLKRS